MPTPKFLIRDETPEDITAITDLTAEAFATLEISDHTEQYVITACAERERWPSRWSRRWTAGW